MAETEVLKLRKELLHARETIEDLQEELRLTDEKYLNLKEEYERNKEIIHQARDDLTRIDFLVDQKVEEILAEERKHTEALEELLQEKKDEIERMKVDQDRLVGKEKMLNDDVEFLRRKIDDTLGGNFEMQDAMKEIKRIRGEKDKKEKEIELLVQQLNDLSNQTENLIAENRVLREMAGTPENFGIKIMDIKLAEREKIEEYKMTLRHYEDEIHELEKERAILKARLRERPTIGGRDDFLRGLSKDQIILVEEFISSIRMGREMQSSELEALRNENEKLKAEILRLQRGGIGDVEKAIERAISKRGLGKISEGTEQELLERIQKENAEMMRTMKEMMKNMGRRPANLPTEDVSHTEFSRHKRRDDEETTEFISKHRLPPTMQKTQEGALGDGHSFRFSQKDIAVIPFDKNRFNDNKITKDEFSFMQLALIECIELHSRKDEELKTYTIDFPRFEGKLRQFILQRNELYKEYSRQCLFWKEQVKINKEQTEELSESLRAEKIKNQDLEKVINDLHVGMRDPELKQRLIELTKKCSILEVTMMQLTRKYLTLQEEYKIMHNQYMNVDKLNKEKEILLEERIMKLKDWKSKATLELKYLYKKLRESVSQTTYQKQQRELETLREKEVLLNDITVELNELKLDRVSMERARAENDERRQEAETMRNDVEQELQLVVSRLKKKDAQYAYEKAVFDKIISSFKTYKFSPQEAFESFDKNKDGLISREEFGSILQHLRIDMSYSDMEAVMKLLDVDSNGSIRYPSFIRTLKRYGIQARTKEDEILLRVADTLKRKYITLEEAFKIFDRNGSRMINKVEFMDNLKSMARGVREEDLNRLVNSIYPEETSEIDYRRFCRVFERMLEKKPAEEKKLQDDWKIDKMNEIDFKLMEQRIPLAKAFIVSKDGTVSKEEFARLCDKLSVSLTPLELDELYYDFAGKAGAATFSDIVGSIINAKASKGYRPSLDTSAPVPIEKRIADEFDIDSLKTKILILQEREKIALEKVKRENEQSKLLQELIKTRTEECDKIDKQYRNLTSKYFELQEQMIGYETRLSNCKSKEDSSALEKKFEIMERDLIDKDCAMQTYKSMYEALVQQVRSLELAFGRKKDEVTELHKALLEVQSNNDKDNLIGKLYYVVLLSRWSEGTTNRKYDESLTELKRTRNTLYSSEAEFSELEKTYRGVEERLQDCSHIITELREQVKANTTIGVSIEKLRELVMRNKILTDEKIDIELVNIRLREENTRLSSYVDELENAKSTWQEVADTLRFQSESELGRKIIELSERLSHLKLSELRANRDAKAAGEKSSYMEKLYSETVIQLKKLEEELAMNHAELVRKGEEYRLKDIERERLFFELKKLKEAEPVRIREIRSSFAAPLERPRELIEQAQSESSKNNAPSSEVLRQLKEQDDIITELRAELRKAHQSSRPDYEEHKKSGGEVASDVEKKQMAEVTLKTIQTLESIINNQKEQIKRKDAFLVKMREENEKEREANVKEINRLQQELAGETQNAMGQLISYGKEMSMKMPQPMSRSEHGFKRTGEADSFKSTKDKDLNAKIGFLEQEVKSRDAELTNLKKLNRDLQSKLDQIDKKEHIMKTRQDLVKTKAELNRVTKEYGKLKTALDKLRQDMTAYTDKNIRQEANISALTTKEQHFDKEREQLEKRLKIANNEIEKQKKAVYDAHEVLQESQKKEKEFNNEINKLKSELEAERVGKANLEKMLENEKAKESPEKPQESIVSKEKEANRDLLYEISRLKGELYEYKLRLLDKAYENEIVLNPEFVVFEVKEAKPISNVKYIDEFIDKACEMIHPSIDPLEIFKVYANFKSTISEEALWYSFVKIGLIIPEDLKPIILSKVKESTGCDYETLSAALKHKYFAKFIDPELLTLGKQALDLNLPNSQLQQLFSTEFTTIVNKTKVEEGLKKIHAFDQPKETDYIATRSQTFDKHNASTIITLLEKGAKTYLIENLRSSYSSKTLAENFSRADTNMDHKISKLEFEKMLLSMKYEISEQKVRLLSSILDPTNSGLYSFDIFCFQLNIGNEDQQIYKILEKKKLSSDCSIVSKRAAKLIGTTSCEKLFDEFQRLDEDESGLVSRDDALALFTGLQIKELKKGELQMMLQEFDPKNLHYYCYHALMSKIRENAKDSVHEALLQKIQNICMKKPYPLSSPGGFRQAFLGQDREGKISGIKFKSQLSSMIPEISEEELEMLHQKYREQDGRVDPKYFVEDLYNPQTGKPVPLSTVAGKTTTVNHFSIRGDADRGTDFRIDQALKGKMEELKKENENIKKENNLLNHRVAQLEKMKMETLARPLDFNESKMLLPKRMAGETFTGDTLHSRTRETPAQYSSKLTALENENLELLKKLETEFKPLVAKQKSDIEKLKADIKFLKLDNLKLQSQIDKMTKRPMSEVEMKSEQEFLQNTRLREQLKKIEEQQKEITRLEERNFGLEQSKIELQFERENFALERSRMERRIKDLEEYQSNTHFK